MDPPRSKRAPCLCIEAVGRISGPRREHDEGYRALLSALALIEERYGGPVDRLTFYRYLALASLRSGHRREALRHYPGRPASGPTLSPWWLRPGGLVRRRPRPSRRTPRSRSAPRGPTTATRDTRLAGARRDVAGARSVNVTRR